MQDKLYKRSSAILAIVIALNIGAIIWLFSNKNVWIGHKYGVICAFVAFALLSTMAFAYYDLNAGINYVRKAVKNGDVAMAKIIDGTFVRFARDARLHNHVYWKLNVELYDDDFKKIETTIIEKFSTHQTQIPKGHVYVTFDRNHLTNSLIIPNVIISSIPEYQYLVEQYEKAIKPTYLNAYYKDGLIIQSYKDSIREQKDYYREFNKEVKKELDKNKK